VVRAVLRHVLGWLFLGLGLAGLVLPVLQGWLFIGIGAVLLSPDVPVFARWRPGSSITSRRLAGASGRCAHA
jgi:uncharacterized membrane protein YbaN (DUF454 family)